MSRQGWFADVSNDDDDPMPGWQPCLETGAGLVPCFNVWFDTREAREKFIRDEILPIAGGMATP